MADDLRLPSIDALRAFEAAARLGTFERAADELSVTASAIGKRIASLEDLLGTPLLLRGPKALSLSAVGKEYLEQVRAALTLLSAVPLHRRSAQRRQKVRLSSPPTFAREVLVPALPDFTSVHDDIELEITLTVPYLEGPLSDPDLEVRYLATDEGELLMHDPVLPLVSPALLADSAASIELLRTLPMLRTPAEPWLPWFRAQGLDWPEPDRGPRLVDLGMTLEAAACGQGVALARPSIARAWLRAGRLQPLLGAGRTPGSVSAFAYRLARCNEDAAVLLVADWVSRAAADAVAQGAALTS
ncbi:LysR family transcriptional regulator [Ideonella sp. 4Y16]|uniref:LysR family transcriptional regulator n=1 Tax=Ideonella alba TaxID=2824118 RepID=A0A940Y769_9BURK|nr:LysR family transcriptional regulator [Ideonella alba]MBQ0929946.1 LysR family transcriptional regulator [Ideonella alba]MBQ0942180.1 LysR family transcriptional regulator [Ideonella alba]